MAQREEVERGRAEGYGDVREIWVMSKYFKILSRMRRVWYQPAVGASDCLHHFARILRRFCNCRLLYPLASNVRSVAPSPIVTVCIFSLSLSLSLFRFAALHSALSDCASHRRRVRGRSARIRSRSLALALRLVAVSHRLVLLCLLLLLFVFLLVLITGSHCRCRRCLCCLCRLCAPH